MITECYSMFVYCENSGVVKGPADIDHQLGNDEKQIMIEVTGRNRKECLGQVKRAEWRIRGEQAWCPGCCNTLK